MSVVTLIEARDDGWTLNELIDLLIEAREKIPEQKRSTATASVGSHQGEGVFWVGYQDDER